MGYLGYFDRVLCIEEFLFRLEAGIYLGLKTTRCRRTALSRAGLKGQVIVTYSRE